MNYLHVYLPTDESTILPRYIVSWVEDDSVALYQRQVEQALLEQWPSVEVDVTTYAHSLYVETDLPGVDKEVVISIIEKVWAKFDWLVTE